MDDLTAFLNKSYANNLKVDSILANPNARVIISISGITNDQLTTDMKVSRYFVDDSQGINNRSPIVGFIGGDLSFGGRNDYIAPLESAFDGINRIAGSLKVVGNALGIELPDVQIKTQFQTALQWTGSQRASFSIPIIFLAWRPEHSILNPIRTLIMACNPESMGNLYNNFLTVAPGKYEIELQDNGTFSAQGTSSVKYGKWFKANKLVIKSFSINIGKEANKYGEPFFASGQVEFEAFTLLSGKEISDWFIGRGR